MSMLMRRAFAGGVANTYATWANSPKGPSAVLSGDQLTVTNSGSGRNNVRSTISKSSGKWYWEVTIGSANAVRQVIGIATNAWNITTADYCGADAGSWGYYGANGQKYTAGGSTSYGITFGTGDVIGVAMDLNAGTLTFYKNGASQGVAFSGLSGTFYAAMGDTVNPDVTTANFGASAFAYPVPSGFNAGLYS